MSRMAEQQLYIHGGYTSATSGRTFETINPANGNVLATVQAAGREDVDRAVKSAQQGQKIWAAMTAMERSRILRRAVDILRERNNELAKLETLDTGKAYSETSTVDIVTGPDCPVEIRPGAGGRQCNDLQTERSHPAYRVKAG